MRVASLALFLGGCIFAPSLPSQVNANGPTIQLTETRSGKHLWRHVWKCGQLVPDGHADRVANAMADDPPLQEKRVNAEEEDEGGTALIALGIIAVAVGGGLAFAGDWRAGLGAIAGGMAANVIGWPVAFDGLHREEEVVGEYNRSHHCR
jgi:hypothetical protein